MGHFTVVSFSAIVILIINLIKLIQQQPQRKVVFVLNNDPKMRDLTNNYLCHLVLKFNVIIIVIISYHIRPIQLMDICEEKKNLNCILIISKIV